MFEYNDLDFLKNKLKTNFETGLTQQEVDRRLISGGRNVIESKKQDSIIKVFFKQLQDPMIYILFVATAISFFFKEYNDAIVVISVVFFNAIIGAVQERKTEKSLEMLKKLSSHKSEVIRDGKRKIIDSEELVKGDLICLESGNSVGADIRVIRTSGLQIDESSITGESKPVKKIVDKIDNKITNIGDKHNMAYMSTMVVAGKGLGIVVSTGMKTEIGKIASILKEDKSLTPLQKRLFDLSKLLGVITIFICAFMFVIALLDNRNVIDMLLSAISLAVAAIPEGLPAVVTIVLAIGVQRMIRVNAIIKRLPSVETLGAVNIVCSDKTGTLTENKLKCDGIYESFIYSNPNELNNDDLKKAITLCNNAYKSEKEYIGSSIEVALLKLLENNKINVEGYRRIEENEFDSTRKMMSVLCVGEGGFVQYTKGAYDRLINKCNRIYDGNEVRKITNNDVEQINKAIDEQANKAKRILAFAMKNCAANKINEEDMIFLGFMTFVDPPRAGVKEAIEKFKKAGVKTVMITGDYVKTAFAIAKDIGVAENENECINGEELDLLKRGDLSKILEKKSVFARVSPKHKAIIVEGLKENGNIVAMTGDGVNDAPSLKKADIGISMGMTGSDVAKESSDMILIDDNFVTIETAIEEGRTIYNNIKKSVLFLLSSNFAEIIVMVGAIIFGLPLPLLAMHILIVNLLTDSFPALALGADCKDGDIMKEKPRKSTESLFSNGGLINTVLFGGLIAALTFLAFSLPSIMECFYFGVDFNISNMKQILLDGKMLAKSQTYAFVVLSLSEIFYAYAMRNDKKTIFYKEIFKNRYLNLAMSGGVIVIYLFIFLAPLRDIFALNDMVITEFMVLIAISASILFLREIIIALFHVKQKN